MNQLYSTEENEQTLTKTFSKQISELFFSYWINANYLIRPFSIKFVLIWFISLERIFFAGVSEMDLMGDFIGVWLNTVDCDGNEEWKMKSEKWTLKNEH